jgi:hypothetical protein
LELRLGVNRVGRAPKTDFQIPHATISSLHCELEVTDEGVFLRDCGSTNGTFVNGEPVKEARLLAGQAVRLGDVELLVESTEVNIAIPQYERPLQAAPAPVVLADGTLCCPRHVETLAVFRCTHCGGVMCQGCVHVMKRQGGAALYLCNQCSHKCERIMAAATTKKKGFLGYLQETVKLKFGNPHVRTKK